MSELDLPACPICQAQASLSRETRLFQEKSFVWYECSRCGSILLQTGSFRWTYQKIGVPDKTYLLKQPMTAAELRDLLPGAPAAEPQPAPTAPAADEAPAAAPARLAIGPVPEPEPGPPPEAVIPIAPAPVIQPRAFPRVLIVAIVGLTLCLLLSLVALIVTMMLNGQATPTPGTGSIVLPLANLAALCPA